MGKSTLHKIVFALAILLCCMPFMSAPYALFLGLIYSVFFVNPLGKRNSKITSSLLKIAVVGLGFGVDINTAISAGQEGFVYTIVSISLTLFMGVLLGRLFKVEHNTAYLVASGTAICGGSAIAATAPVTSAKDEQITVALGVVFILNAIALFIFPGIGHWLELSQKQFGVWAAIAIHDTSSVVGAASAYGNESLVIATTIKLIRALWIIPLVVVTAIVFKKRDSKIKIPYFIGLFVLAMIVSSYVQVFQKVSTEIVHLAKTGFTITLFLIGSSLSPKAIKKVGVNPIVQGLLLWLIVSVVALLFVLYYV